MLQSKDIDTLLDFTLHTILTGDLNAKHIAWHSHWINTTLEHFIRLKTTAKYIQQPRLFSLINSRHNNDKYINLQFDIENLNDLFSDYNPIIINLYWRPRSTPFQTIKQITG